ncbi:hypothetical protein NMY22_g8314 [Coprinellus aureogranulatus]|nr:hypothetical protein NMY22_g8314 [Coprinellus aureogranulatus]
MIRRRDPGHFDALAGPILLSIALFFACHPNSIPSPTLSFIRTFAGCELTMPHFRSLLQPLPNAKLTHVRPLPFRHAPVPGSLHLLRLNHTSLTIAILTRHATTIRPALDRSHPVMSLHLPLRSPYTVRELQRKEVPFPGSDLLSFLAPAKNLSVALPMLVPRPSFNGGPWNMPWVKYLCTYPFHPRSRRRFLHALPEN